MTTRSSLAIWAPLPGASGQGPDCPRSSTSTQPVGMPSRRQETCPRPNIRNINIRTEAAVDHMAATPPTSGPRRPCTRFAFYAPHPGGREANNPRPTDPCPGRTPGLCRQERRHRGPTEYGRSDIVGRTRGPRGTGLAASEDPRGTVSNSHFQAVSVRLESYRRSAHGKRRATNEPTHHYQ